jgi:1,2-dihydroxy-3-keto-5-methylthiopentene dioxygenase
MSELRIYSDGDADKALSVHQSFEDIRDQLAKIDVSFERWEASAELDREATQDEIIAAYREPIDRLMKAYGFKSVDVISLYSDHPQRAAMREGEGLFNLRAGGKVYAIRCKQGDLLNVPAGITHWFDLGAEPQLKAIRLFTTPEGWVATFTGDKIADRFPRLEAPHYPDLAKTLAA